MFIRLVAAIAITTLWAVAANSEQKILIAHIFDPTFDDGRIEMISLDGQNRTLVRETGGGLRGLAVDGAGTYLYWSDLRDESEFDGVIFRASTNTPGGAATSVVEQIYPIDVEVGTRRVFWAEGLVDSVESADLNGGNRSTLFSAAIAVQALALDKANGKIYAFDQTTGHVGSIVRSNLDGSDYEVIISNVPVGFSIAVDPRTSTVYWTSYANNEDGGVYSVAADGTNFTQLLASIRVQSIAIDTENDKIIFGQEADPDLVFNRFNIYRMNLDGSDHEIVATGFGNITKLVIAEVPTPLTLLGDADIAGGSRADQNRGANATIYVRSPYRLGLIDFDPAPIEDQPVTQARLYLSVSDLRFVDRGTQEGTIIIRPITSEWDEGSVTWRTRPLVDNVQVSRYISSEDVGQTISIDVTEIVQRWADGTINPAGLQIETSPEISGAFFHSRESTSGYAPELSVETGSPTTLTIAIELRDSLSGELISNGSMVTAGSQVQVSVRTNGVDCAGQFVVTANDYTEEVPVLVQSVPFIIGPNEGSNVVTGEPIDLGTTNDGTNAFKVSATCNGYSSSSFAEAFFEIQVN